MAGMVCRGVLLLCWHRLGCGSEDRALALYIRDAWLGTTNWGTSTNRRPIEPTDGTGRRPQRHRQIRSTLSDTCHGPPKRPFSPRPKASPTGRPYLARVGSGLRRFSVPLLLTGPLRAAGRAGAEKGRFRDGYFGRIERELSLTNQGRHWRGLPRRVACRPILNDR